MKDKDISKMFFRIIPNSMSMVRCHIKRASEPELSFAKFRVLANIDRKINTVGDIAEIHGVSQPAVSKLVDCLVKEKYILRQECANDRRVIELTLTSSGRKKMEQVRARASKAFEPALNLLTVSEQNELSKALKCLEAFFIKVQETKN